MNQSSLLSRTHGSIERPAEDVTEEIAAAASARDPIEGITLQQFVTLSDELARRNLVDRRAIDGWLDTQGVPVGAWTRIAAGWSMRMARHPAIRDQYSSLVRARRARTIRIELSKAEICGATGGTDPTARAGRTAVR